MIKITAGSKQDCCGCSACEQACPEKCIVMREDAEGFRYPKADASRCIGCGLCEKSCPVIREDRMREKDGAGQPEMSVNWRKGDAGQPGAFGGWHKDEGVRRESSSGGAFSLFAEYVLSAGGIVYGCALNERLRAVHAGVERLEDLGKLRGSKYVQSDICGTYREIKAGLDEGRMVLFTGTPCQAAGLRSFLRKKYDNLYVIDFICHGVPSPKVFESYVKALERKYGERVVSFKFRCKDGGWKPNGLQLGTGTGTGTGKFLRHSPGYKDAFMNGFLSDIYLRPSCYACRFKRLPKDDSDITIADFWGVHKEMPQLFDGRGTSLVLINSAHGREFFGRVRENFHYKECELAAAVRHNRSLVQSAAWNPRRNDFFRDYARQPFERVEKKYMSARAWAFHKACRMGWGILEGALGKMVGSLLKLFHCKWSRQQWDNFMQFVKFSMAGCTNVAVSYFIYAAALWMLDDAEISYDYVLANLASFALSVLWAFYCNDKFVFTRKRGEKRTHGKTLLKTYVSYAFTGIVLRNVLSVFWIRVLGISKYIVPFFTLPVSVPVNFFMNKRWAFSNKGEEK